MAGSESLFLRIFSIFKLILSVKRLHSYKARLASKSSVVIPHVYNLDLTQASTQYLTEVGSLDVVFNVVAKF